MKTKQTIDLQVNDGKTVLAIWSDFLDPIPTIGETISVGPRWTGKPANYGDLATVSKIEINALSGAKTIILEASPAAAPTKRPVVFLNENYVPDPLRQQVESLLRSRLNLPVFEWLRSPEPNPITQLHSAEKIDPATLRGLQNEIRGLIAESSDLVVC